MIPLESYHKVDNIDDEKESPVLEFNHQDLKEDISIPIDVFDHEIENIDKEKESPVLEFKQQDLEQNEMIPLESYHEIENIDREKETLVLEFKQQDLKEDRSISGDSHHDDENKTDLIPFDLTSEQDFDNNNKFIVEEKEPDDTSSITSIETLKIDDLKEIMVDLNDNYQLPSPIVIPNKKENDNYVKQLPLVIPESTYIEPAYKKKSRAFFRIPRESRVSSSVPELSRLDNVKRREVDDGAVGFTSFSTRDYESSDDEEVGGLRDYIRHQSWQNQQLEENIRTINKQTRTLIQDEVEDLQMAIQMSEQMYEKNNVINNYNQNTQLIQQKPKKEINENPESSSLIELMMLEDVDLIQNFDDFQCPICLEIFGKYEGVILRDCHHTFCRDCLRNTIRHCEEPTVKCPYTEKYACEFTLRDLEIKSLVNAIDYEKHILKSLIYAENTACKNKNEKSFHCLSPDCPGWCYYQGFELAFNCNVCGSRNCLVCKVIHPLDEECWDHFDKATNAQTSKLTEAQRQSMIEKREIMECSNCQVAIVKNEGCDGIICTMCKTMLCWPRT
ncbi:uncharacterized protein LOC122847793 [Aphidius gifuensis]|nr:uncharacterized protein LOC122847793 [Aphidius gifuensis]